MSENQNPFAARSEASSRVSLRRRIPVIVVTLAALLAGLFGWSAFRQQAQKLGRARAEATEASAAAARSLAQFSELKTKLTDSETRIAELAKEKEMAGQMHRGLEEEMRAALESKDVTISQLQGKLTVNILDRILFDSGEAILK